MARVEYLIKESINRNQEAFEELIKLFLPLIYKHCYKNIKNHEDVQDAIQEIVMRIWNKISLYDFKRGNFSTWVITLIHNQLVTIYRRNKIELCFVEYEELDIIQSDYFDFNYHKTEVLKDLYIQLTGLEYNILIHRVVYNMSYKSIANIFKITPYMAKRLYKKVSESCQSFYL